MTTTAFEQALTPNDASRRALAGGQRETEAGRVRTLLLLLAFANFAVGMAAFSTVGVLSPIKNALAISTAQAGWLMTLYAIVYAVSSPLLIAATGRFDRSRVLVVGLGMLTFGAALAGGAPGYAWLLSARAVMAVGAGLITPVAVSIAIATTSAEQRGRSLATVYGGLTLAQALGVPLGAWLGYSLSWRASFVVVAAVAGLAALTLARAVPRGLAVPPSSLKALGSVLSTPRLMAAVSFTTLFMAAIFSVYTYLGSFLEVRYGLARTGITAMFLAFGVGAILGNSLGGYLTDRIGGPRALVLLSVVQIVAMPALTLLHAPVLFTGALILSWSVFGWSMHVPQQARLAALDPTRAPVLLALHAAAIYVGSSLGSVLGGRVLSQFGHGALGVLGAGLVLAALLSLQLAKHSAEGSRT